MASATASPSAIAPPSLSFAELEARSINEWSRCHHGFVTGGDSQRDVLRLGLLCGPVTGMQLTGPRFTGLLSSQVPTTVRIDLDKECIRIVAAAAGSVEDLELELSTPKGQSLVLVNVGQPWAVLPQDKPLCTEHEGTYKARLTTHAGEGQYALRVLRYWPTGKALR